MAEISFYDPKKVTVLLGGVIPVTSWAPDAFLTIAYNSDQASLKVGALGDHTRALMRDMSAKVTMRVLAASPINDIFAGLAAADRLYGTGVVSLSISDLLNSKVYAAANAWVVKQADDEYAQEAGIREWVLETGELVPTELRSAAIQAVASFLDGLKS